MSFTLEQVETGIKKTAKELNILNTEDSEIPATPETRNRIIEVPKRHGQYYFGADLGRRDFTLEVAFIYAQTWEELQEHTRKLNQFILDKTGRPRKLKITFDMEPGKWYYVYFSGSIPIERQAYWSIGFISLPFTAFDPHAYADKQEYDKFLEYDQGHEYDTGLYYPNEEEINLTDNLNMHSFKNYSWLETPFILEIDGSFKNLTVENDSVEQFKLETTGNKAYIDTGELQVSVDGENSAKHFNGDFFWLQPGENKIYIRAEEADAKAVFRWYHRYL